MFLRSGILFDAIKYQIVFPAFVEFPDFGGFQLLDLIITELKSHMTKIQCLSLVEITAFKLESKSCKGFF
jgi:hypothetical protein